MEKVLRKFSKEYIMGKVRIKRNNNNLMTLMQGNDNLRDYMNKFTKTMTDVMGMETNIMIHVYMGGVCPDLPLVENLTIHKVRMLSKLFSRAMFYIETEEFQDSKR